MSAPLELLEACAEAVDRQHEMLPVLARAVGVVAEEVYYTWARRACMQHGDLDEPNWHYFFHGLECDLNNSADGRRLRLDFGPQGTVDTFTAWGVFQFIYCSAAPWREFAELRDKYRGNEWAGDDYRQGITELFLKDWDHLEHAGFLAPAEPSLVELERKSTSQGADGIAILQFPPEMSEEMRMNCFVAHRPVITPSGWLALEGRRQRRLGRKRQVTP